MPFQVPKAIKPLDVKTLSNEDWAKGVVSAFDSGRTPISGLKSSTNTILEQDGVISDRPSLVKFGPQPLGTILGQIYQYRYTTAGVSTNYLMCVQVVAGVANLYKALPEATTWTKIGTETFNVDARVHFEQQDNKVVILNGEDNIAYYDIVADDIVTFSALPDATAPTLKTLNGLTGTSFNIFYAVTADSSVGETSGAQLKQPVSTDRDLWDPATQSIVIQWSAVTGAKSYNVYCSVTADGTDTPTWGLLMSGISASTLEFTDKGNGGVDGSTGPINMFKPLPETNTTAGPRAKRAKNINGQLWLTGDKDNPYNVWHDGGTGFQLDFTFNNGGGYTKLGQGNREVPTTVWNFRSGPGDAEIKALTNGVAVQGKRYTISPVQQTYGNQQWTVWAPQEDYGYSGTNAPDTLVVMGNNTYYYSPDGFKSLGTKPQYQNLLSDDDISQTIQPDMKSINNSAMDLACGVGFEGRLYFTIPTLGQPKPNQIWVCDIERGGAWMKPWEISVDWMMIVEDNTGIMHHVVYSGGKIMEFTRDTHTSDDGVPFPTSGETGLIYFSKDGRTWARLRKLVIETLRPQGHVDFIVRGYTTDNKFVPVGKGAFDEITENFGYGWNENAWNAPYWSFYDAPDLTAKPSIDVPVEVDDTIRYFSISWSSTSANTAYSLSRIIAEYVPIGIRNLE